MILQKAFAVLAAQRAEAGQHTPAIPLLKTGALVTDRGQTRTWTQARYVENMFQSGYLLERMTEQTPTTPAALDPDVPEQTVEILGNGKLYTQKEALAMLAAQENGFKMRATFSLKGWYVDADNLMAAGQLFNQDASMTRQEKQLKP